MTSLNQGALRAALVALGFTVEGDQERFSSVLATERGDLRVSCERGYIRMVKPNGTTKTCWGSASQCAAIVRQTIEANGGAVAPEPRYPVSAEKCAGCPSCSLVTHTFTGALIGRPYYQCLSGVEADCAAE